MSAPNVSRSVYPPESDWLSLFASISSRAPTRWERICRALAVVFGTAAVATIFFAASLALAVILYNGPLLRFGVGGLSLFAVEFPGFMTLDAFSGQQRLIGATLVIFLCAPVVS